MKVTHANNGNCLKCEWVFSRYPGFYQPLKDWFKSFQSRHQEAHISCAGRGELDQEAAVINKVSRAHWGESAHNYNAAIDLFELRDGSTNIYERDWFENILKPELQPFLNWYGAPGSPYNELPHVELKDWRNLVRVGALSLVDS